MDYTKNIASVRSNLEKVCLDIGRDPSEIILVAAAKTQTAETVGYISGLIGDIGENRVQEFVSHYEACLPVRWHFIGRLQTNKVKYLIGKNVLIHSLDRRELALEIDRLSLKAGTVTECLVEINIGGEQSKGGAATGEAVSFVKWLESCRGIKIKGIMSVLPRLSGNELEKAYAALSGLFAEIKALKLSNLDCIYLSAGMSDDYAVAVRYGANIIRLGTAIFGPRA